ncbi:MAG: NfeD family protein [Clostridia bacterium]|nr:NfeD family protein [Clostridia bacterium]
MEFMLWVWIGVIAVAMILEAVSLDMTSIWFAVGGICGLIFWACGLDIVWQIVIFVIVSGLCIAFLRRITKRLISKPTVATNIDKLIGTNTKLIEPMTDDQLGAVKLNGIVYSVKSVQGGSYEVGTQVSVVQIDGNKLIVTPIETNRLQENVEMKVEEKQIKQEEQSNEESNAEEMPKAEEPKEEN